MSERIVKILVDYSYESKCMRHWTMSERPASSLQLLADAANAEQTIANDQWVYVCIEHGTCFPVHRECPGNEIAFKSGETLSLPAEDARRLVEMNVAVYPTHDVADEQPSDFVGRVNVLLEQEGLPLLDNEAASVVTAENHRISKHYRSKPGDSGLARDLGMSPEDIAEMRNKSKGT